MTDHLPFTEKAGLRIINGDKPQDGRRTKPTRYLTAIIRAAKAAGAVSIAFPDGIVIRFVDDAPPTASDQASGDEWANAKPL